MAFCTPARAQSDVLGQTANFFIDSNYDSSQRDRIPAVLEKVGQDAYFYVDKQWWESINEAEKNTVLASLDALEKEFHSNIYPTLISNFGLEWRPGIDKDVRVTVLIHPMQSDAGGYFASKDEMQRLAVPNSNEREMVYLNSKFINTSFAKSFLAHELMHLITYNQKDQIRGVSEDIWLDEARAEYAPTLCGYDSVFDGSNLQKRVKNFLDTPNDPLIEWQNIPADYGVDNLFIQYLVDHYGVKILSDSLRSSKVGIGSINYALLKNGFDKNFSQIFTDWTITVLINDCTAGKNYCYSSQNLNNIRVIPQINVLPSVPKSILSIGGATKNWSGSWYKIIGGKGTLTLKFTSGSGDSFKVPYIVKNTSGLYAVNFLTLDKYGRGEINVSNFATENASLFILPSIQNESLQQGSEPFYSFSWSVTAQDEAPAEDQVQIQKLLARIDSLKKQIAAILAQRNGGSQPAGNVFCPQLNSDLSLGIQNNNEVKCLQQFLKDQGTDIYPEGHVTGFFGNLTKAAVIKFQEKYASEILTPVGLSTGTGFVGSSTRAKINKLLASG